jgi:CMP/dCMP kinase
VRAALLAFQRGFGAEHGAVLDGRDIGTVIFPDAAVKLFVTASLDARARRRWLEQCGKGVRADLAVVAQEMRARDAQDAARTAAPLRPAEDAVLLDTTALDADAAFRVAMEAVRERLAPADGGARSEAALWPDPGEDAPDAASARSGA